MTDLSLAPFFSPTGVAVIGASRDPTKLGYGLARNLALCGFEGAIHFVNPRGGDLLGRPIYKTIGEVPDPVDLAVILAPPALVPGVLRECAARGIKAAIISTGGFRETGHEGALLEQECLRIARENGMRFIGPNCIGILDTHVPLDTTFLQPPPPTVGEISFISHSGAICAAVVDWVRGQGLGYSSLFSLGNQTDVNETDILDAVGADRFTKVVTMYMEGVSDGRRFVETARRTSKVKPVIALKVGRFDAGRKAAASHTGALAGQEAAFDAGFARGGVFRANTTEEMFQWAKALAWCPLPKGRRVAVLTNAGGPGVTAADALELNGLKLAELSQATHDAMKAILPAAASLHNPVDMLASAPPEHYAECLRILLADDGVDSVMVITPPPPSSSAGQVVKLMIPVIQASDKPVMVVLMGHTLIQEGVEFLRAVKLPEFRFPEQAASALGILSRRVDALERLQDEPAQPDGTDATRAAALLKDRPAGWLAQDAAIDLLESYGLPTVKAELAENADQAAEIASRRGWPVVIKVASPDISHKSDVGGVLLNMTNEDEVREGFATVTERARAAKPQARIEGAHVQRMLPAGQDVIVGVVRDPQFGPLVMFGSGGVEVEGLKDVAFALAPLTRRDAEELLEKTWAGRKLKGFRNLVPADRAAVVDALIRMGQLALEHPSIAEMEINPLRVLPEGEGAFAVDVRVKI